MTQLILKRMLSTVIGAESHIHIKNDSLVQMYCACHLDIVEFIVLTGFARLEYLQQILPKGKALVFSVQQIFAHSMLSLVLSS